MLFVHHRLGDAPGPRSPSVSSQVSVVRLVSLRRPLLTPTPERREIPRSSLSIPLENEEREEGAGRMTGRETEAGGRATVHAAAWIRTEKARVVVDGSFLERGLT